MGLTLSRPTEESEEQAAGVIREWDGESSESEDDEPSQTTDAPQPKKRRL